MSTGCLKLCARSRCRGLFQLLGSVLPLEPDAAVSEEHYLAAALGIEEGALVKGAYVDLLAAASATQAC